jgi:hypothetical protein
MVDEFRTSVNCHKCWTKMEHPHTTAMVCCDEKDCSCGHEGCGGKWLASTFKEYHCEACRKTIHRDRNAAFNIKMLVERRLKGLDRPEQFSRGPKSGGAHEERGAIQLLAVSSASTQSAQQPTSTTVICSLHVHSVCISCHGALALANLVDNVQMLN